MCTWKPILTGLRILHKTVFSLLSLHELPIQQSIWRKSDCLFQLSCHQLFLCDKGALNFENSTQKQLMCLPKGQQCTLILKGAKSQAGISYAECLAPFRHGLQPAQIELRVPTRPVHRLLHAVRQLLPVRHSLRRDFRTKHKKVRQKGFSRTFWTKSCSLASLSPKETSKLVSGVEIGKTQSLSQLLLLEGYY